MGMGEPLLNYDATVAALRILMDPEGFAIAPKKLTLSTVGILPALEKLMQEPVRPNLAISLHAPNAALRRELMPIEEKYPHRRRDRGGASATRSRAAACVTYEYVLLRGVNDTPRARARAGPPARGQPRQGQPDPAQPRARDPVRRRPRPRRSTPSAAVLADARVTVSVRRPRGQDILAACGQLHLSAAEAVAAAPGGRPLKPAPSASRGSRSLLLGGAPSLLLPALGAAPLERAEIYFLDGARAMVESGRLARAALPGRALLRQAGAHLLADGRVASSVFGFSAEAARLVPALAALGVVAGHRLARARLLLDRRAALAGAVGPRDHARPS